MQGGIDHRQARSALGAAAARSAALIGSIDDGGRPTAGLTWSLAETAAHMVMGLRAYADSVRGDLEPWRRYLPTAGDGGFRDRLVAVTASGLDAVPERDPATLGRLLVEAAEGFLAASEGLPPEHLVLTPWYGDGDALSLGDATALLLGEQLIHGRDLATTLRRPWPIRRGEALMVVVAAVAMMPRAVNPAVIGDVDLTFAFHIRGGRGFAVRVSRGSAASEPLGTRRADCHLWFDPVAFLLVGYGRISPLRAVARGGALASGRRPWLAFRFKNLFFDP